MSVLSILKERGFIEDQTHTDELEIYLSNNRVTCYIGFDPTASSLHVGSLVCIMTLAHMQRNGHRPIALVGGGTGLIGDPSGKTELRKIITQDEINVNKNGIRNQLARFLDFSSDKALLLDNAKWLTNLEYIPFLRDIGRHFSVNRMIKAEAYKARMDSEDGLTFIEFNYMLLQAYDFMQLAKSYDCLLQMGGSDQWGNIVAGVDLVRRTLGKQAFGITFPLITTASGIKMGKTHKGAVWLDPERFSPYEYYQFWVNTDDADVHRFLSLFTFLPMEEVNQVRQLKGSDLNKAKAVLAYEATKICHGEEEALNALRSTASVFGAVEVSDYILPSSTVQRGISVSKGDDSVPSSIYKKSEIIGIRSIVDLLMDVKLCGSKSDARRLIQQGGAYINGTRVSGFDQMLIEKDIKENEILLRAGKKKYHKIILSKN
ncbi:MAG: tyrosine--tRNA ligase [Desulfobacula sp.]|jgi:tyrosyl-tRNA synthetase